MNAAAVQEIVMLVVEDNPADVVFLEEAIEASQSPTKLHVVGDGGEAMKFLRRQGKYGKAPRPDMVVLDLNLPILTGEEVLRLMAADAHLQSIPVAVLTTSTSERSICRLYTPGRCRHFIKTSDFEDFQGIVAEIENLARSSSETD